LTTGIITTFAGGGSSTSDGIPAVTASINPGRMTFDPAGNMFLISSGTVRKIDTSGIITTAAGNGLSGLGSDDLPTLQTPLEPTGLAWDVFANRLLIGEYETRLREIFYTPATTTTLTLTPDPVVPWGTVTMQATVSPATATGNVHFYQDAILPGSGVISSTQYLGSAPLVNGNATLTWAAPISASSCSYGTCLLRAVYAGDPSDNLSSSGSLLETIQQGATSTTLVSTPNPSIQGQNATFTATVTPATATGVFFITNGSTQLGSYNVTNGSATFTLNTLPVGSNSITAKYSGSVSYVSSSATVAQVVQPGTSVSLTSSANPSLYGASVTLTAAVAPASATGTVQFLDGTTVLGSVALTSGSAALTISTLVPGSHSLTAIYSGDANDPSSTSPVLTQTVNKAAASVVLVSSLNPSTTGQTVTFTATVSPSSATGTVQFLDGSNNLGIVTLSAGTAPMSLSSLALGTHLIAAIYSGDTYFANGSQVLAQVVNAAVPPGDITTIAGTGAAGTAGTGGPATSAQLTQPSAMGMDSAGNLYVADRGNNRVVRIDSSGILTTFAGTGAPSSGGDGGPASAASLYGPIGIAVDSANDLFISEGGGNRVRRVDGRTGIITTVAGNGNCAFSGDGGPAANASLCLPMGLALDSGANL
jgi:hypothetical protein